MEASDAYGPVSVEALQSPPSELRPASAGASAATRERFQRS